VGSRDVTGVRGTRVGWPWRAAAHALPRGVSAVVYQGSDCPLPHLGTTPAPRVVYERELSAQADFVVHVIVDKERAQAVSFSPSILTGPRLSAFNPPTMAASGSSSSISTPTNAVGVRTNPLLMDMTRSTYRALYGAVDMANFPLEDVAPPDMRIVYGRGRKRGATVDDRILSAGEVEIAATIGRAVRKCGLCRQAGHTKRDCAMRTVRSTEEHRIDRPLPLGVSVRSQMEAHRSSVPAPLELTTGRAPMISRRAPGPLVRKCSVCKATDHTKPTCPTRLANEFALLERRLALSPVVRGGQTPVPSVQFMSRPPLPFIPPMPALPSNPTPWASAGPLIAPSQVRSTHLTAFAPHSSARPGSVLLSGASTDPSITLPVITPDVLAFLALAGYPFSL
jgi:hypothetical protein